MVVLLFFPAAFTHATAPYEIIALGDTQYYNYYSPPNLLGGQNTWIKNNLAAENIVFVSHMGDVTDDGTNVSFWNNASASMSILDGPGPDGVVPYSVNFGNHDLYAPSGPANCAAYFGPSRYQNYAWHGGSAPDSLSFYQKFTAGGITYLHLNLKFAPDAAAFNWAKGVLDANPNLPAIVTTHDYLGDGFLGRSSNGNNTWNNLVYANPQIFMVLCGHNWPPRHEMDTNVAGKKVVALQVDYQEVTHGGDAWLQKIVFDPDAGQIRVKTYSPTLDAYQSDHYSEFSYSASISPTGVTIHNEISPTQRYWNGGGAPNANWTTAANWGGTAPSAGELLTFRGAANLVTINDFPAGTGFAGILIDTGAGAFTLSGNAVALTGDFLNANYSSGHDTILNLPIAIDSARQFNTGDVTVTANGVIGGTGSLTKTGGGTLVLAAANTYTGDTTVLCGAIAVANAAAIPGNLNIVSGSLHFKFPSGSNTTYAKDVTLPAAANDCFWVLNPSSFTTVRLTGKISGGAPGAEYNLADSGASGNHKNILVLDNPANDFQGIIYMSRGTLGFTSNAALGNASEIRIDTWNANGQLRFDADNITLPAGRSIRLVTTGQPGYLAPINVQGYNAAIAGPILGIGLLSKMGAGTLTLSGANSYTGGTTVNAGTLIAANGNALGTAGVTISAGAALNFSFPSGSSTTIANHIALPTAGSQQFTIINPAGSTSVRLTGKISGGAAGQTYRLVDSGAALNHDNVLILDNALNDFRGNIEMWRGTLAFTSNAALGYSTNKIFLSTEDTGGALRFDANNITIGSTRQIVLYNADRPFPVNLQNYTGTIACPITGGSAGATLLKRGTGNLILAGSNTFLGTTEIVEGTLTLDATGQIPNSPILNGGSFVVAGGTSHSVPYITGSGTTSVLGAGTILATASIVQSGLILSSSQSAMILCSFDGESAAASVPEPNSWLLTAFAGIASIYALRRKKYPLNNSYCSKHFAAPNRIIEEKMPPQ
ncbi:MAG: autotransporter-associated beta strand repeat-containing protein [Pirellulales bacterium]|nr:autotransporter-associated beta strand repeat-containing protein [Pirellulales bacterium]